MISGPEGPAQPRFPTADRGRAGSFTPEPDSHAVYWRNPASNRNVGRSNAPQAYL